MPELQENTANTVTNAFYKSIIICGAALCSWGKKLDHWPDLACYIGKPLKLLENTKLQICYIWEIVCNDKE